jgi:quercetin dioxygenase-like cupin family protein
MGRGGWSLLGALVLLAAAGCGGGDEGGEDGDGALGGSASVETLARADLERRPAEGAAWSAFRVRLAPGERLRHTHALSTVWAEEGGHVLRVGGERSVLGENRGSIVQGEVEHVHEAPADGPSVFWDVLLDAPDGDLPEAPDAEVVFRTGPLEDIPPRASVSFLDVTLPPQGGRTTVHTHPGPETIFVLDGPFEYQNALEGSSEIDRGAERSIPPGTAVQKRNPGPRPARFLSWFVVDPRREFAPPARFGP